MAMETAVTVGLQTRCMGASGRQPGGLPGRLGIRGAPRLACGIPVYRLVLEEWNQASRMAGRSKHVSMLLVAQPLLQNQPAELPCGIAQLPTCHTKIEREAHGQQITVTRDDSR